MKSLVILVTAVPWKKGEVRSHGAIEMVCRNGANTKGNRCGDHGMAPIVSHEDDGVRLISKDGCLLVMSYLRIVPLKCSIGAGKEITLVKIIGGGSTHAGGMC